VGEIPDARRDTTGGYVQISLDMKLWALEKIEPYLWGKSQFQVTETSLPSMRGPRGSVVKMLVIERGGPRIASRNFVTGRPTHGVTDGLSR
jgi:hypothetical protein